MQDANETSNFHNGKPLDFKHDQNFQQQEPFMPTVVEETILRESVPSNPQQVFIPEGPTGNGPLSFNDDDDEEQEQQSSKSTAEKPEKPAATEQEKQDGARYIADKFVQGFCLLCTGGEMLLQIGEKKIKKLEDKGIINTSIRIPALNNETVNNLIRGFNADVDGALQPDDELKEKMAAPLAAEFYKRGWYLNSTAQAGAGVLEGIGVIGYKAYKLYGQRNDLIDAIKDCTLEMKKRNQFQQQEETFVQPQPQTPQYVAPQPQQSIQPQPQAQYVEPINNETSVALEPSVTIVPDGSLPTKGTGVRRGRKAKLQ